MHIVALVVRPRVRGNVIALCGSSVRKSEVVSPTADAVIFLIDAGEILKPAKMFIYLPGCDQYQICNRLLESFG